MLKGILRHSKCDNKDFKHMSDIFKLIFRFEIENMLQCLKKRHVYCISTHIK